jgi:hypothetical protein
MLIRSAQMAVFRKQFDERLHEYVLRFLREELTSDVEDLSDEVLQRRIELTLSRARSLGIDGGLALQIFFALTFGVGPHFDRHPVVKKIVHDSSRPMKERMAAVMNELSGRVWHEMTVLAGADEWSDDVRHGMGGV